MALAWGTSWGVSWGVSWGSSSPAPVIGPDTHDGDKRRIKKRRKDNEKRREDIAAAFPGEPIVAKIEIESVPAAIVASHVESVAMLSAEDNEDDDEDAMMALL
jgi:hypothetical protein